VKRDVTSTADGLTTITLQGEHVWRLVNTRILQTFAALVVLGSLCLLLSPSGSHPAEEPASVKLRVWAIAYSASVETSITSDGEGYTSRVSWYQSGYKPTVIWGKIDKEKGDESPLFATVVFAQPSWTARTMRNYLLSVKPSSIMSRN